MTDIITVKGTIYRTHKDKGNDRIYIFPENKLGYNQNGVGVAFSGGGGRSYVASIGYMRAMSEIILSNGVSALKSNMYHSSVSGGSWFSGVYLFAKHESKILLGKSIPIFDINSVTLQKTNFENGAGSDNLFMGSRIVTADVVPYMISGYEDNGIKPEYLWNYAIGKIFLEPYCIDGKIFTFNDSIADRIRYQTHLNPITPRKDSGFWLCNMTVLNYDTYENGFIQCQVTPIYTGVPAVIGKFPSVIGGIFTDSYTFGCYNPLNNKLLKKLEKEESVNTNLNINKSNYGLFTLDQAIGTSSAAYGYYADILSIIGTVKDREIMSEFDNFNPLYNMWSIDGYRTIETQVADGYICDNTGILSLLSRGCKSIIAFDNNSELEKGVYTATSLLPLFGIGTSTSDSGFLQIGSRLHTTSTQVFRTEEWIKVKEQFDLCAKKGNANYAKVTLNVLPNEANGINGGYDVDILIIILAPSNNFNNQIPENISSTFTDTSGPYPLFPTYPTMLTNDINIISLTEEQVNLLSSFTHWSVMETELKDIIKEMYEKYV